MNTFFYIFVTLIHIRYSNISCYQNCLLQLLVTGLYLALPCQLPSYNLQVASITIKKEIVGRHQRIPSTSKMKM